MKKVILSISAICTIIGVVLAICSQNHGLSENRMFELNVEALTNDESIPTIPCARSTSSCTYLVQDAFGNTYIANTAGMRNIE